MDRTERFYRIEQMLHDQGVVGLECFLEHLGVSRATFKRDLDYLRDRLHAPIEWDRKARGYRLAPGGEARFELPGLWFNASEIHALLTMQHLLANLQPGLLAAHIAPLQVRLDSLLEQGENAADEVRRRIRILHAAARPVEPRRFQLIAQALLNRRRLRLQHYNRAEDLRSERVASPQRLVYYRDNWYLDAWCHWRNALRSFAVDSLLELPYADDRELLMDILKYGPDVEVLAPQCLRGKVAQLLSQAGALYAVPSEAVR